MAFDLVEGWTAPVDYQLLAAGVAISFSGMTSTQIAMELLDRNDVASTSTGPLSILDSTGGTVRFLPTSTMDFQERLSPYYLRFLVIDGTGRITYFPNADPEVLTVRL